ncbi:MAG: PD40 domain-containing protein [Bacteroidales bacterium]|nr:PD40 domain-containing protein [Bacteroidales bacterium]
MAFKRHSSLLITLLISLSPIAIAQQHQLIQLTFSDSTHDGYPYWSPDGSSILYCSGTQTSCYTMKIPAEGGNPELITEIFAQHARWSPEGTYIAFDGDFGSIIQIIPSMGGVPVRIDPDTIPVILSGMPCWSPDGSRIAFHSRGTIYILELRTGATSEFFRLEGKLAIPFDWSTNGEVIVADVRDTVDRSRSDLWLLPLDGEPRQLSFLEGRQVKPSFSPDGSMVLFTSNHGGNADLWVMPAVGGEPVQLTFYKGDESNPGYDVEASWSPNGSTIAFSSTRTGYWAIWKMELDVEALKKSLF